MKAAQYQPDVMSVDHCTVAVVGIFYWPLPTRGQ